MIKFSIKSFLLISGKAISLCIMMVLLQNVSAQTGIDKKKIEYHPRSFIGIGHGINSYTGMTGLSLEFPFDDRISMFFSGGLGTWDIKQAVGLVCICSKPQTVLP